MKIKLIGVLKGLSKKEEIEIKVNGKITLKKLLKELVQNVNNEEFKKRIFLNEKEIAADILISYNDKIFPAKGNENFMLNENKVVTILSFVHGG